ncbi:MAG TPA: DUF5719 family protein [Acidimicrobiales bacterium]
MSPRLPFVVLVAGAVAGAVLAGTAGDDRAPEPAAAEPGVEMPAAPAADVLASTWYCAAGTAEDGGEADHTVVVLNPGGEPVTGTVSVFAGEVAAADPEPASDGSTDGAEDASAATADEAEESDGPSESGGADPGADGTGEGGSDAASDGSGADRADAGAGGSDAASDGSGADRADAGAGGPDAASDGSGADRADGAGEGEGARGGEAGDDESADRAPGVATATAVGVRTPGGARQEEPGPRANDTDDTDGSDTVGQGDGGEGAGGGEPGPTLGGAWNAEQDEASAAPDPGTPDGQQDVEVPPGGRVEVRLADVHRAPLASALVELDGSAVVEHEVAGPHGRDAGPCASTASTEWFLASGSTARDARDVLVLFNPFPSVAAVDIVLSTDDGLREPVRYQGLPVPAGGVVGVDVGGEVTRRDQVAATVRSRSGPIVVERLQTFDGSRDVEGLALALAAPSPLGTWVFPAGTVSASRGERIVLYNPGDERAEVDVSVHPVELPADAPPPQPFGVTVRPGRYEVIDYAEDDRVPRNDVHTTVVRSRNGVPVVAERVQTFTRRRGGDVAAGPGAAFAAPTWLFATLGGGDRPGSSLVAFNPDPERPARVSVTGLGQGAPIAAEGLQDVEVPPGGLRRLDLGDDVAGPDGAVRVVADAPVVVERLITTPGGLIQAMVPGLPAGDAAVPVEAFDLAG